MPGPSRRRATIADVAALAGVSRAAVSQVFNDSGSIGAATAQRIRAAADALNWEPSRTAVALRTLRSRTIGLVFNRTESDRDVGPTGAALITGLESVLTPHNYGLLLYLVDGNTAGEPDFYRQLAATRQPSRNVSRKCGRTRRVHGVGSFSRAR